MNDLKHFGNSMFGPDEDVCRACGVVKPTVYMHEGVCKECRDKDNSTTIIFTRTIDKAIFYFAFILGIIEVLLLIVTVGIYGRLVRPNFSVRLLNYIAKKHMKNEGRDFTS